MSCLREADRFLDGCRNRTSPHLMEAMIFLRKNKDYWGPKLILKAFKLAQGTLSPRAQSMVNASEEFENTHNEDEDD